MERSWAVAAYGHAETHYNLLCVVPDARYLRLSLIDEKIYGAFREMFPGMNVDCITEDDIKSDQQKELWRSFCTKFEKIFGDYNFATLLRLDSARGYDEDNTCVGEFM
ncbi:unnamed protein product [Mesocestoides corti]|uniref:Polysaccharide biosynthesis domain-containing protein n=1 Tax=Mesocestoides corti TaxID=53468 RepID=A0A3P6G7R7_MESCO|nr:unnamed protein product [Mesocestoides corti]